MADLDDKDCVILELLQDQGDLPNTDLARQVGLSPAATLRRVQRLRAEGVISGVRAMVDPARVGIRIEAFVLVALAEHAESADVRFAAAVKEMPSVLRADSVTGPDDILLHVVAADTRELQEVLRALPRIGARRVTTLLRLEGLKDPAPVPVR
jgi:Lrp/AsnC family leucine-responsive transcriptional regulator